MHPLATRNDVPDTHRLVRRQIANEPPGDAHSWLFSPCLVLRRAAVPRSKLYSISQFAANACGRQRLSLYYVVGEPTGRVAGYGTILHLVRRGFRGRFTAVATAFALVCDQAGLVLGPPPGSAHVGAVSRARSTDRAVRPIRNWQTGGGRPLKRRSCAPK